MFKIAKWTQIKYWLFVGTSDFFEAVNCEEEVFKDQIEWRIRYNDYIIQFKIIDECDDND